MKHIFTLFLNLFFSCIAVCTFAQQETKPNYTSLFEKGNRIAGIEFGVAGEYPINSVTQLNISKSDKNYGLLLLPSYGWFVEKNWVFGGQAILGFSNTSYSYTNGSQFSSSNKSKYSDFGIAPYTRYFVPLGKRNVVSLFGHASMPIIYSTSERVSKQTGNLPSTFTSNDFGVKIIGSLGLGVSLNGRFGSLEANANNTGLYLGFHKYFRRK